MRGFIVVVALAIVTMLVVPALARKPIPPIEIEEMAYVVDYLDPAVADEVWQIVHDGDWDLLTLRSPMGCWDWWGYNPYLCGWIKDGDQSPYPQLFLHAVEEPGVDAALDVIAYEGAVPDRIAVLTGIPE